MEDSSEGDVDRRSYLKLVGPAGIAAIAGCFGGGDEGPDDDGAAGDGMDDADDDGMEDGDDGMENGDDDGMDDGDEGEPATPTQLRLVYDTHIHGRLGDHEGDRNVANYFGLARDLLDDAPGHGLLFGGGDDLHMSVASSIFEGQHVVEVFNEAGLDYVPYGNHEFDLGPEACRTAVADSQFTWLSANVVDERTGEAFAAEDGAARYAIEEVDGLRIGLTGLAPANTADVTSVGEHVEVLDPAEAVADVIDELADENVDLVFLLSHLASPRAEALVEAVEGIDLVPGGDHAGLVYDEVLEADDTLLSFVGDELDQLGQLDLELVDGEIADYEFEIHDVVERAETGDLEPHQGIADAHERYDQQLADELDEVIGETTVDIDVRRETVRQRESGFGSYIADVIRADTDADLVIQNGGGIRSDRVYEAGDLMRRTVVDILPFPNDTCSVELTGDAVRGAIEHGVGRVEDLDGRFPQVSGMSYAYDPDAPEGERVDSITVDGDPLEDDATYVVGTNDFLLAGGDGYGMIEAAEVVRPPDEGQLLSAAVSLAIERDGVISPEPDGRIERL